MKYGISDMRITNEIPESWQDLQDKVCKYLNQAGYHWVIGTGTLIHSLIHQ